MTTTKQTVFTVMFSHELSEDQIEHVHELLAQTLGARGYGVAVFDTCGEYDDETGEEVQDVQPKE